MSRLHSGTLHTPCDDSRVSVEPRSRLAGRLFYFNRCDQKNVEADATSTHPR